MRRREALGALGGLGLSALIAACGGSSSGDARSAAATAPAATASGETAAAACVLSPETTEGPYWIEDALSRRDIREGKAGLPLVAQFTVQDARSCEPIAGADVEIWHCDADGVYSGFGEAAPSTRFLRGHQQAGDDGVAEFLTVFPGWYGGRTPHVHLKVHVGGDTVHTGQVFFDEETTARVYESAPYSDHGEADTSHDADGIYAQAGGERATMRLTRDGEGYRGTISLGVAT